jgi:molybdopterin-guanine dinucleotide biosynthesis protein A
MNNSIDALILAGGENKRLPILKGFLEIDGKRIIESNIDLLKRIFDRVIISTNMPEHYFYLGLPMVGDTMRKRGPMTGILSALNMPEISEIFVTACDMPFISGALIRSIVDQWNKKWDAVIPVFDKRPQPLLGIYSKIIAQNMENSINNGTRSLRKFLEGIHVLYINEEAIRKIDREGKSFVNINTPEDVENVMGMSG